LPANNAGVQVINLSELKKTMKGTDFFRFELLL